MNTEALNIIFGIIGTVGTILGIVGIVLTVRSVKKKEPVYHISSTNLISAFSPQYKDLKVSYKNRKTENLTATTIIFFNKGAERLNHHDLTTVDPLRIIAEVKVKILDVSILLENNPSCQFRARLDAKENHVLLDFDYLSKDQGARLQVIHTGLSSQDLDIVGDIKDVTLIRRIGRDVEVPRASRLGAGIAAVFTVLILAPLALGFAIWTFFSPNSGLVVMVGSQSLSARVMSLVSVVIMLILWIYMLNYLRARFPKSIPYGLEFIDYIDTEQSKDEPTKSPTKRTTPTRKT